MPVDASLLSAELEYYIALSLCQGIGAKRLIALVEYFGGASSAYQASHAALTQIQGFGSETANAIVEQRDETLLEAKAQLARVDDSTTIVTYFDDRYPSLLKNIYNPPALLYCRGNVELLHSERSIAIIGTRHATDYGKRWARAIAEELVKHDVTVVSGFAQGIDTCAHTAAFKAGGSTVAVLGSGVDVIYPSSNKAFASQLRESDRGLLVSELPPGSPPDARNFPWRNRIVNGLSNATVIVESDVKGGSMITASMALDENREVFAVPGDLDRPTSAGPNLLIRESRAKLIRSTEELLMDLGWSAAGVIKKKPLARTSLTLFENKVVDVLEAAGGPIHVDDLAHRAELEVHELLVQLLGLEFKGVVRQMAGKQFTLVN